MPPKRPPAGYADIATLIALARGIDSPKARAFVKWADGLGRLPTTQEFEAAVRAMGFRIVKGR